MIHVIYTINYLIVPKPSIELIIGVLYLFLRRCTLVTGDRKFHRNWVKNKWKFIGSHKWKVLLWVWLWASHGLNPGHSHAVSFSPSLDFALALFSCIFSHDDETATRPPLKRGLKFPGVIIKPPNWISTVWLDSHGPLQISHHGRGGQQSDRLVLANLNHLDQLWRWAFPGEEGGVYYEKADFFFWKQGKEVCIKLKSI